MINVFAKKKHWRQTSQVETQALQIDALATFISESYRLTDRWDKWGISGWTQLYTTSIRSEYREAGAMRLMEIVGQPAMSTHGTIRVVYPELKSFSTSFLWRERQKVGLESCLNLSEVFSFQGESGRRREKWRYCGLRWCLWSFCLVLPKVT